MYKRVAYRHSLLDRKSSGVWQSSKRLSSPSLRLLCWHPWPGEAAKESDFTSPWPAYHTRDNRTPQELWYCRAKRRLASEVQLTEVKAGHIFLCSVCSRDERRETRVSFAVRFYLIISFPLARKRIDLNGAQQKIVRQTDNASCVRLYTCLETYNPTNKVCLPKFVRWDNASSRIKTATLSYHRPRWTNRTTHLLRLANLLLIFRLSVVLIDHISHR